MSLTRVYVANRGEIAARIERTCAALGVDVVRADVTSYLDGPALIADALAHGADAVHPGYGFLSENAGFARAVAAAGLTWIGPTPESMEAMARKDHAREIAEEAGVPVTPRHLPDAVPADAYPVLVKAAAGGGGKGMHVVHQASDLAEAIATAAREAASAFGDDTLIIEQYVEGGRHVEVQVFGDTHGNVVHLGTRDCSAQRRHQKVVEEAPAPELSPALRTRLHTAAVDLARAVGYVNAGTVEFLVRGEDAYFLEMNTRLQVEHPVTEEVTGTDLVAWQLAVAAGELLPLAQDAITFTGHALEARIYAEDPYAGFLPQAGRASAWTWPIGARVEHDFDGEVSTAFDPMIAKVIVHGADRDEACRRLADALGGTSFSGLTTNTRFLRRLVDSAAFRAGEVHTGWLDSPDADVVLSRTAWTPPVVQDPSPFGVADGWRVSGPAAPRRAASPEPDPFDRVVVGGPGDADVKAPMPGTVIAVAVVEGESVVAGQRLGALEAMKMELGLTAPHDGVVQVFVKVGDQVTKDAVLVHVEPATSSS